MTSTGKTTPCMLRKGLPCFCRVHQIGLLTAFFSLFMCLLSPQGPPPNLQNGVTHRHLRDSRSRHRRTMRDLSCHDEWSDASSKQVRLAVTTNNGIEWQRDNLKFSVIRSPMRLWQSPGGQPHTMVSAGEEESPCHVLLLKETPKDDRWHLDLRQGAQNQLSSESNPHATRLTSEHDF